MNQQKHTQKAPSFQATGQLSIHPDGFGFVNSTDGESFFIPKKLMSGVLPQDEVTIQYTKEDKKTFVSRLKVVGRKDRTVALIYHRDQGFVPFGNWLVSWNITPPKEANPVANEVWLATYDAKQAWGEMQVLKVQKRADTLDYPSGYHTAYLIDGNHPPEQVHSNEILSDVEKARTDLTHLPFITVDGSKTKDFDDAVYVQKTDSGWAVKVAIADVSAFVEKGSKIDEEALRRGTTTYMPNDVRPMLPATLADDKCSLIEGQPRAVMCVSMEYDEAGVQTAAPRFENATIKVARRCLYEEVERYAAGEAHPFEGVALKVVSDWKNWFDTLEKQQDMIFPWQRSEHYIHIDEAFQVSCEPSVPTPVASKMVELAMIAANRAAAVFVHDAFGIGAFRNHQEPDFDRGPSVLEKLGWEHKMPSHKNQKEWWLAAFKEYAGKPEQFTLAKAWTEIQKRASYESDNKGHNALDVKAYTHFTSPIRRYADVHVHRAIKAAMNGDVLDTKDFQQVLQACNDGNRRARDAERAARQHWMSLWWSQRPADYVAQAVVKAVKKDGTVVVQTKDFGTVGALRVPESTLRVGDAVDVRFSGLSDANVLFQEAKAIAPTHTAPTLKMR
jgi:VacB/RNase II family 3'-5' exoribonuclease